MKTFLALLLFAFTSITQAQTIIHLNEKTAPDSLENIKVEKLAGDSLVSSFLIWIKVGVAAHFHADHSEHVMMLEGEGTLTMNGKQYQLKQGDMVFIPKGTVHSFANTTDAPAKILSIQAPQFDGTDRHFPPSADTPAGY